MLVRALLPICLLVCAFGARADVVVPTRTIRAQERIGLEDLQLRAAEIPGAYTKIEELAGLEARVALYPGRPVRPGDVGPPAVVERNQLVPLRYDRNGLRIQTEGRALDRGGVGDWIKVMNSASRATVMGRIMADGTISVTQ